MPKNSTLGVWEKSMNIDTYIQHACVTLLIVFQALESSMWEREQRVGWVHTRSKLSGFRKEDIYLFGICLQILQLTIQLTYPLRIIHHENHIANPFRIPNTQPFQSHHRNSIHHTLCSGRSEKKRSTNYIWFTYAMCIYLNHWICLFLSLCLFSVFFFPLKVG